MQTYNHLNFIFELTSNVRYLHGEVFTDKVQIIGYLQVSLYKMTKEPGMSHLTGV
jgi:hypothetical protein